MNLFTFFLDQQMTMIGILTGTRNVMPLTQKTRIHQQTKKERNDPLFLIVEKSI